MSFEQLKKNRSKNFDKLVEASKSINSGAKSYGDDRFWKPSVDKAGNGYSVIRFLPASEGSDLPWVRYWDHGFQGPSGLWYIEKSLTSIGQDDPVSEMNSVLWNSGNEADKEIVRKRKRRLHYVSNIYVVTDPDNPENEGKVFLFQYGKKIFDKIMDVMQPEFQDEEPIDPFDFWEGVNFKLKIRQVEGYRNYDKSEFESPKPLSDDDEELEKIYNSMYGLQEFVDPNNYKSYTELKNKLIRVLGDEAVGLTSAENVELEETANESNKPKSDDGPVMKETEYDSSSSSTSTDDDDDTLSYFAKLAAQD